jgi:hypothetical protein
LPPWIETLQQRDSEFAQSYLAQRERILKDGAIPAKYKHLMTMIVAYLFGGTPALVTAVNAFRS